MIISYPFKNGCCHIKSIGYTSKYHASKCCKESLRYTNLITICIITINRNIAD